MENYGFLFFVSFAYVVHHVEQEHLKDLNVDFLSIVIISKSILQLCLFLRQSMLLKDFEELWTLFA